MRSETEAVRLQLIDKSGDSEMSGKACPGGLQPVGGKVTRVAVLNSHPIQYFAPLYTYLNTAPDLKVTALYLSDVSVRGGKDAEFGREVKWDIDLLAGYESVFLGKAAHTREPAGFWSLMAPQVWREVRSGRYDALWLHGHNYAANLVALAAAKAQAPSHDARRYASRRPVPKRESRASSGAHRDAVRFLQRLAGRGFRERGLLSSHGRSHREDLPCSVYGRQ